VIADACRALGIGIDHAEIAADGTNSFFVSINNADGELVGGVADMNATEGMTPSWLAARAEVINSADAVVADANSSAEALAWLIDNCRKPLFMDAVSVAKAGRIKEAVALSRRGEFFALKCNAIENVELASVTCCSRRYVSVGAEGLRVQADGRLYEFPALPCLVRNVTGGGDALLAGIVHAGPDATVEESARWGLECARCAVESPKAVSDEISKLL
jgi:pseudouridine kinase